MAFVVFSLPRSRSAWMAHYLSSAGEPVGHDIGIECRCIADFLHAFRDGMVGTCETGSQLGWRVLRYAMPEIKFVTVRRPLEEVLASLSKFGLEGPEIEASMLERDATLDLISSLPGTLQLSFHDLGTPEAGKLFYEFCLDREFDYETWARINRVNIQVDMRARLAQLIRNRPGIENLKAEVLARTKELAPCQNLQ